MEATAKWDFEGGSKDLLSFKQGDVIQIIERKPDDQHWYLAQINGAVGLVSQNMIDIKPCPWYFEKCRMSRAEKILKGSLDQIFIIRRTKDGQYFLSYQIRHEKPSNPTIRHFLISKTSDGCFNFFSDSNGVKSFNSLNQIAKFVKGKMVGILQCGGTHILNQRQNQITEIAVLNGLQTIEKYVQSL